MRAATFLYSFQIVSKDSEEEESHVRLSLNKILLKKVIEISGKESGNYFDCYS